jgi:HAL2 family 3'(2'),5'-bisphosphate nucleotidase
MITLSSPETKFALHAVQQAAMLVKQVQAEMAAQTLTKGDRSPVTVADFASQALVGCLLSQSFPADPLVAEEDAHELRDPVQRTILEKVTDFVRRVLPEATPEVVCDWIDRGGTETGERFWTLDPIDGTKGFLRGEQYAVALALVVAGEVQLGVLGCPNLSEGAIDDLGGPGSLVVAVRGQGTWTTSLIQPGELSPLHASRSEDPRTMRIMRSVEAAHTNAGLVDQLAESLNVQAAPLRMDSQGKYAVLAAGAGDLMVRLLSPDKPNYREKIWDQAAGSIIIEEAGGRVSDLDGKPFDFSTGRSLLNNRGVVASNGAYHALALKTLKELGA